MFVFINFFVSFRHFFLSMKRWFPVACLLLVGLQCEWLLYYLQKLTFNGLMGNCEEQLTSTDCRPTVGRQITNNLPTGGKKILKRKNTRLKPMLKPTKPTKLTKFQGLVSEIWLYEMLGRLWEKKPSLYLINVEVSRRINFNFN